MSSRLVILLGVLLGVARLASAQPDPAAGPIDETVQATKFDPAACVKVAPVPPGDNVGAPPVTWNDFDVVGELRDPAATVRTLLEPTMSRHRALTQTARDDIGVITTAFGYHLVGVSTKDTPTGLLTAPSTCTTGW